MNKGISWAVVAGLAVLALAIAGCGGGDDETTPLTQQEFVKQANEICKKQEEVRSKIILDVAKESEDSGKPLPTADREKLVLDSLPPYEEMAEEIGALGAPEGKEQKVEDLVSAMEKTAADIKANPLTAVTSTSQFEETNELALGLDLPECTL